MAPPLRGAALVLVITGMVAAVAVGVLVVPARLRPVTLVVGIAGVGLHAVGIVVGRRRTDREHRPA